MSDVLKFLNGQVNAEGQSIVNVGDPSGAQDVSTKNYVDNVRSIPLGTVGSGGVSGTLGTAQGGSGLSSIGTSSQILGVNTAGTALEFKTLSGTSNQVSVAYNTGSLVLSLPQSIATTSTPTFAGLTINPGPLFVGTTSGIINSNEGISNRLFYSSGPGAQANAIANQISLTSNVINNQNLTGSFGQAVRTISADVTETCQITGGSYGIGISITSGHTYTNSSGAALSALSIRPLGYLNSGTIAANYQSIFVDQDNTAVTGRKTGLLILGASNGSVGQASISDNQTYSGSWFIHSTGSNPSLLSGSLTVSNASGATLTLSKSNNAPALFLSSTSGNSYLLENTVGTLRLLNDGSTAILSATQGGSWTLGVSGAGNNHVVYGQNILLAGGAAELDIKDTNGVFGTNAKPQVNFQDSGGTSGTLMGYSSATQSIFRFAYHASGHSLIFQNDSGDVGTMTEGGRGSAFVWGSPSYFGFKMTVVDSDSTTISSTPTPKFSINNSDTTDGNSIGVAFTTAQISSGTYQTGVIVGVADNHTTKVGHLEFYVRPAGAGGTAAQAIALKLNSDQSVVLYGNVTFGADDTYSIGGLSANSPRNLTVTRNLNVGVTANCDNLIVGDGTEGAPGFGFKNATASGFWRFNNGSFKGTAGGTSVAIFNESGWAEIKGRDGTTDATSGYVGQYDEDTGGSTSASGSNQWFDAGSKVIPAGDWDVTLVISMDNNGATISAQAVGISPNSGNTASGLSIGVNRLDIAFATAAAQSFGQCVANYRVKITSPTTYYAKALFVYSSGTPQVNGHRISYRRH